MVVLSLIILIMISTVVCFNLDNNFKMDSALITLLITLSAGFGGVIFILIMIYYRIKSIEQKQTAQALKQLPQNPGRPV